MSESEGAVRLLSGITEELRRQWRRRAHPGVKKAVGRARRTLKEWKTGSGHPSGGALTSKLSGPKLAGTKATEPAAPSPDLVSLIVPFYNVADYFGECLESIVAQTHRNLQIILVDDGSPDNSIAIARKFAERDSRVQIVQQPNRGLGAARNTGIAHATGAYIAFADSDDVLPPTAMETMVRTLSKTKSDFVVGTARRMERNRKWIPNWAKEVHNVDRFGIRLAEHPEILKDVFAWNKLFNRDFFNSVVKSFPEGIRYEDQEPTARAYANGTFDVLTEVVYDWRVREDGTSITQQKSDPRDLADRLLVKQHVSAVMADTSDPDVYRSWLAKAIGFDLRSYYEQVPRTDLDYWKQLQAGVASLTAEVDPETWQLVPLIDRLPTLAAMADNRDDVIKLMLKRSDYTWRVPGVVEDGVAYLGPRYLDDLQTSPERELLRVSDPDLKFHSRVTDLRWDGPNLRVVGFAYISGLNQEERVARIVVHAISQHDGTEIELPVEQLTVDGIDQASGDAWNSYAASGFAATLDVHRLYEQIPDLDADLGWHLRATVDFDGVVRSGLLIDRDLRGPIVRLPVGELGDRGRWTLAFDAVQGLVLQHLARHELTVEKFELNDLQAEVVLSGAEVGTLRLESPTLGRTLEIENSSDEPGRAVFRFSFPEIHHPRLQRSEHQWSVQAVVDDRPVRLIWPGSTHQLTAASPAHLRLRLLCSRLGTLRLQQNHWWASVEELEQTEAGLTVRGRVSGPPAQQYLARLANDKGSSGSSAVRLDSDGRGFQVTVALTQRDGRPFTSGGYSFRLSARHEEVTVERWVPVAEDLQRSFPWNSAVGAQGIDATRTQQAAALWVSVRKPFQPDERGRLAQRKLHQMFADDHRVEPRDAVLFESFNGKSSGDSVLALFEELRSRNTGLEFFWTVADYTLPIPAGATPLLIHSRAWMEVLSSARYLVNNNNFPFYFRKKPHQTYVQTWHGTPLKRIGNDVPSANLSLSYRELMKRESGYWDYLLAQNSFAAVTMAKAFDYHGAVVNTGYPRNDSLLGAAARRRRAATRRQLGIEGNANVVLYAPTWRDNVVTKDRRYGFVNYLDFDVASSRLPSGTRFLLRGHANTTANAAALPASVIDVSSHPDINDLMLAADMLVTDYSSVMFDFAVTGKPIFFLTPDLELYRDTTRGFYLDFETMAPGPLCRTTEELVTAMRDLPKYEREYQDRYAKFIATFAANDDGSASKRVADRIWPADQRSDGARDGQ
ncbi:MAG: tagF 3 [Propionibacteriaceae bacterium]|nr:tagF 3 [Propionibacteriaceae bacterium]